MTPVKNLIIIEQKQINRLEGLREAVNYALVQMKRSHCQLTQIESRHEDWTVRREARKFIAKNEKLQNIATDLSAKISEVPNFHSNADQVADVSALVQQYSLEVELLHDMHFAVARTYVGFIHQNYQTQIIALNPMAA